LAHVVETKAGRMSSDTLSGPLPISENARLVQILLDQNTEREKSKTERAKVDALVLQKFDEVSATALVAAETAAKAKAHGEILIARMDHQDREILGPLVSKVDAIDLTTRATNGKVKDHDVRVEVIEKQVKLLLDKDGARTNEAITAAIVKNAQDAVTKGVFMIPKPDAITVATALGSIAAVITLIATGQLKKFFIWIATKF
jgi:hypothetical protein